MDNGWESSASAWIASVDGFEYTRRVLLDPVMLSLCGDMSGLTALDIGCGEGRFCRMLSDRGAKVVGLDPTDALVKEASNRGGGTYLKGDGEKLPFANNSFDLVVSYLVLLDIPDYREAVKEMARVCRPGGRIVVGNLAPHASTTETGWVRDEEGNRRYFPIIDYLEERRQLVSWNGISVVNYHRPLQDYMSAFLSCGLILKDYREPAPSEEQVAENPNWEFDRKVPYLHAMQWEKPKQL